MSAKTLPLLFINLGGEMMYIIDQRLRAQSIQQDKSNKVLNDIVGTMFNKKFIEELFNPQEVYNKNSLYSLFEKLAHASIMRLNSASMDKLFDLMMMAFKYQVFMCQVPSDVLMITMNHLDSIRKFVSSPQAIHLIEFVHNLLLKNYGHFSVADFQYVRQTLLSFFQDLRIRVSIFLKTSVQKPNGHFIVPVGGRLPSEVKIPGSIRIFDANGKIQSEERFNTGYKCFVEERRRSVSLGGDHITTLGTNMYADGDSAKSLSLGIQKSNSTCDSPPHDNGAFKRRDSSAKNELALLEQLLGNTNNQAHPSSQFTLNLFGQDDGNNDAEILEVPDNIIQIDATKVKPSSELSSIMEDLNIENSQADNDEPDLLELMDSC